MKRKILLLTTLAAVALCGHCSGASIGLTSVEVEGPKVTLADILQVVEISGETPAEPNAVVVAVSPLPGKSRTLERAEILRRLGQYGIESAPEKIACPEAIEIVRASNTVNAEEIVAAGEAVVRKSYAPEPSQELVITPVSRPQSIVVPAGAVDLVVEARNTSGRRAHAAATVSILVNGRIYRRLAINYRVELLGDILVASHDLNRHDRLTAADIRTERSDLLALRGAPLAAAAGYRATRRLAAGTPLCDRDTEPIPLVIKKHEVIVSVVGNCVSVTAPGIALEDGAMGEMIRVRTTLSKEEFFAKVVGEARVEIQLVARVRSN